MLPAPDSLLLSPELAFSVNLSRYDEIAVPLFLNIRGSLSYTTLNRANINLQLSQHSNFGTFHTRIFPYTYMLRRVGHHRSIPIGITYSLDKMGSGILQDT